MYVRCCVVIACILLHVTDNDNTNGKQDNTLGSSPLGNAVTEQWVSLTAYNHNNEGRHCRYQKALVLLMRPITYVCAVFTISTPYCTLYAATTPVITVLKTVVSR